MLVPLKALKSDDDGYGSSCSVAVGSDMPFLSSVESFRFDLDDVDVRSSLHQEMRFAFDSCSNSSLDRARDLMRNGWRSDQLCSGGSHSVDSSEATDDDAVRLLTIHEQDDFIHKLRNETAAVWCSCKPPT